MELNEAILGRRSCRSYDQSKTVTAEQIREMLEYGIWAPSGTNSQPWRFTVLMGDKKTEFIEILKRNVEEKKANYSEQQLNIYQWSAVTLEKGSAVLLVWDKNKTWTSPQSIGACIQTIMLKAYEMGLGTVWIAAVRAATEDLQKLCGKEDMDLIAGVGIGYPSEKMIGKKGPPRLSVDEVAEFLG